MSITAVLFDFGNVLSLQQDARRIDEMARMAGMERETLLRQYRARRADYDRGDLDAAAYWGLVLSPSESDDPVPVEEGLLRSLIDADIRAWTRMRAPMVAWARALHDGGFKTCILSNMPYDHGEYILREMSDLMSSFDAFAFSYRLRVSKPDAAIYTAALSMLDGTRPEEALFIDDIAENAEGARAAGLKSIVFSGIEELAEELRVYPELPPPARV
jgi:putative hydrolase of the HAD superfamily